MAEDKKSGGEDLPVPVDIDIAVEAGDWPEEAALTRLV
ncbi:MAG: rRNA maturation RNase YbeY, partial [Mesorhizobium sp.]